MNDNSRKNISEAKAGKKDMYTAVLICQIIGVCILMLTLYLIVKPDADSFDRLKAMLNNEIFTVSDLAESVKNYFSEENIWAVFGDNVTVISSEAEMNSAEESINNQETTALTETIQENLNGTGGEDLELYEAVDNTSFAPIRSTSPAVAPIENGRYTSYFGYRINPITNKFSFHTGLDIAASEGTKIRAAFSGKVTKVSEDDRAGKYIFITHDDGFVTFYCHCSEILAEEGANIRQGETIAKVGSTGWSTGPHLHFEVRKDNIRYNPLYILGE